MLLPPAVLAHREKQQADCDEFRERHRNAGDEYQQSDIPVPRAPELENPAENGAVRLAQQSARVHHGQQVRWNVKDDTCNQQGERHFGAERRAMLDATVAASIARLSRSEKHTSELQSPDHLVCRLLLEKKNNCINNLIPHPTPLLNKHKICC